MSRMTRLEMFDYLYNRFRDHEVSKGALRLTSRPVFDRMSDLRVCAVFYFFGVIKNNF